jgi:hypothetical protein
MKSGNLKGVLNDPLTRRPKEQQKAGSPGPLVWDGGHPIFLLSSTKFVHNDFNGLAILPFLTTHLSCRLYVRAIHMVGESPT